LLPLLRSRGHIQAQEGLASSGSSPNREGRRACEGVRQIEHLGSHAIINGGSDRCSSRPRERGFRRSLGSRGFLAHLAHHVIGYVPAGQRGRVCLYSGRPELSVNKVSGVRLR
jgi:hypothetical protein